MINFFISNINQKNTIKLKNNKKNFRYDLLTHSNESATQGMAYVRAMCRGSDSASVVEDIGGLTTAIIAAHEIIHRF